MALFRNVVVDLSTDADHNGGVLHPVLLHEMWGKQRLLPRSDEALSVWAGWKSFCAIASHEHAPQHEPHAHLSEPRVLRWSESVPSGSTSRKPRLGNRLLGKSLARAFATSLLERSLRPRFVRVNCQLRRAASTVARFIPSFCLGFAACL